MLPSRKLWIIYTFPLLRQTGFLRFTCSQTGLSFRSRRTLWADLQQDSCFCSPLGCLRWGRWFVQSHQGFLCCSLAGWWAAGAGIIFPLMTNVIFVLFPPDRRGFAMGIFGVAMNFAPAIGRRFPGGLWKTTRGGRCFSLFCRSQSLTWSSLLFL